jgi:MarR family transcriptional regulator, lower aerobic nicotinate degradation pathway regulator
MYSIAPRMNAPGMPISLQDVYLRPGFLLKRCHQVTAAIFLEHCREFGVTPSQYGALRALQEYPGIDQLAVGRLIGLDRSTSGLVIKLLAERGLLQREVNEQDNRRMRLRLSAAGRRLVADMEPVAKRAQEAALSVLPPAKRAPFIALLNEFLRGHGAVIEPADVMSGKPFGSEFDALIGSRPGATRAGAPKQRPRKRT